MRYKYTEDDITFLKKNYPIGNWKEIHDRFPQLSDNAIHHKCNKLGIKFNNTYKKKSDGHKNTWTENEVNIIRKYYSNVPMKNMLELLPNRNKNMITNKARRLNITSYEKLKSKWADEEIQYIIDNWELKPDRFISEELNKTFRSVKWKREELGLYRQNMESNSYSTLSKYLRGQNQKWKKDSMKASNYKCILTGSKNFEIHHLYGVSNIITDILNKYDYYKDKPFEDYSDEDLSFILSKFLEEQNKYPLGECIDKKLHVLFHSMYGQYYNTPEQWEQFKKDYRNGRYRNIA